MDRTSCGQGLSQGASQKRPVQQHQGHVYAEQRTNLNQSAGLFFQSQGVVEQEKEEGQHALVSQPR